MDEFERKKPYKWFKIKYIIIKRKRIKSDIKIKFEGMKLKKQINSINDSRPNALQSKECRPNLT
jgi:hypothetical protein